MWVNMQRVLEQRVAAILDKLLVKPSLVNLTPVDEGGLLLVSYFLSCSSASPVTVLKLTPANLCQHSGGVAVS